MNWTSRALSLVFFKAPFHRNDSGQGIFIWVKEETKMK
jgi:hypothetical protein